MKRKSLFVLLICLISTSCIGVNSPHFSVEDSMRRNENISTLLSNAIYEMNLNSDESLERAMASLMIAKELNAFDPRIWDGLGSVEYRKRNFDQAEKYFKEAVRLNPGYDRPYMHLALIAEKRGDIITSYQLLRQAIHKNPTNFKARNNLAVLLSKYAGTDESLKKSAYTEITNAGVINSKEALIIRNKKIIAY